MLSSNYRTNVVEAGCDEAGRGCLAGPVFAAAVILPPEYVNADLDDSKKLTKKMRETLRHDIEKNAVAWAVASLNAKEIDEINILKASIAAMHKALDQLSVSPHHIIVDGNRFYRYKDIPHICIIKGDAKYLSIAAASILAKTHRDEYMSSIHPLHPHYNWIKNKGYPTLEHRSAIHKYGISKYHRKTFALVDSQLKFNFE